MNPKAIYRVVLNRRKRENSKDGKYPIEIDCYLPILGERRYIPATIRITPTQWSEKDKRVTYRHEKYVELNKRLKDLVNLFEAIEEQYRQDKKPFHLKYLNTDIREEQESSFTNFWQDYIKSQETQAKFFKN